MLIAVCSMSVAIAAITLYLKKRKIIKKFKGKCYMILYYLNNIKQNGPKTPQDT